MDIKISGLSVKYGEQMILDDINFDKKGINSIGIIGESGCGKSTLLRQLAGIEMPYVGEIEVNSLSPIINTKEFREKIGVVFQKHNLFPHLTLRKNITLILNKIRKMEKESAEKRAQEILELLFIDGVADKRPHEVSGGQAQRGSIARALATDPKLIFLDEPTAALDPILTDEVLKAVTKLKEGGRDFIFVTHEISFLSEFADYIIFLKDGKIFEHGDVQCLKEPKTNELADFLRIH